MSYHKRPVFFSACFGMLLFGICLITLGSVAPGLKEKFQLDELAAGTLFSILPIGILCGSLLFGPIVDRYGYRFLMTLSALGLFVGFQGIAYASSDLLIKPFVFLFGLAGGAINGATNAVVADISTENKAANLSILGVFFAIGALGMPFILGVMGERYTFETVVSSVGLLAFLASILFFMVRFPPPKLKEAVPMAKSLDLFKDGTLLLIAFFLFCQSGIEGLVNNWTTLYLIGELSLGQSSALYALSMYVLGMAVMRILLGSVFRSFSPRYILFISFGLLLMGNVSFGIGTTYWMVVAGLVLIGAGLAAGYPIMLGFVSDRYSTLSGTAFSFVLAIALLGNMALNYLMGAIADIFGIAYLPVMEFCIVALMVVLSQLILKNIKQTNSKKDNNYVSETMA